MDRKPFGEHVEGLSPYRDKTYVNERKVQYDDFQDASFFAVIGRNPFLFKALRKFKSLHSQIGVFVSPTATRFDLQIQPGLSITKFGFLRCKRIGLDLTEEAKVEQFVLLLAKGSDLSL